MSKTVITPTDLGDNLEVVLNKVTVPLVTTLKDGVMSAADKVKLDDMESVVTQTKEDIDALGIDAATVTGNTVATDVPAGAVFTDTVYDDSNVVKDTDIGTTVLAPNGDGSQLTNLPLVPSTISDLTDTTITTPTDSQILTYDITTNKWINSDQLESIITVAPIISVNTTTVNEGASTNVTITNYSASATYIVETADEDIAIITRSTDTLTITGSDVTTTDSVVVRLNAMESGEFVSSWVDITVTVVNLPIITDDAIQVVDFTDELETNNGFKEIV